MHVDFCLSTGKRFCVSGFVFKSRESRQIPLKNGPRAFYKSPPFKRSACFYLTISSEILSAVITVTLKQDIEKQKPFLKISITVFSVEKLQLKTRAVTTKFTLEGS